MNKEALLNEIEKEAFSEEFKKIADYVDMSEEKPTEVKPEEQLNVNVGVALVQPLKEMVF